MRGALADGPGDAPLRVVVKHRVEKIGDTLSTIPWMLALSEHYGRDVYAGGQFSEAVKPLVAEMPIRFDPIVGPGPVIEYTADVRASYDFSGPNGLHMSQGYFALAGMIPPGLPMSLPLVSEPSGMPPGIVISPFCGGKPEDPEHHVRSWYTDRWQALIEFLLSTGQAPRVYVIGGERDDPAPLLREGVVPLIGYPLVKVLGLMRCAPLCVTIDTGTSHLAHYGGVNRHLLLYPEVNFPTTVTNPRARMLRAWPKDISANLVISEAAAILGVPTRGR